MTMDTGGVRYKQGIVVESRPGFSRVRFDDVDGLVTTWLPLLHPKTFADQVVWSLDAGEQVSCILDEFMEAGCILGAIYSDADAPPVSSLDKFRIQFRDGGSVEYDRSNGAMDIVCKGVATLTAGGNVTVKAPSVKLDTPQATCTGNFTVEGLLSYNGGMAGKSGSGGAAARINGIVTVIEGDVVADNISLKQHRTSGVCSGDDMSGTPVP